MKRYSLKFFILFLFVEGAVLFRGVAPADAVQYGCEGVPEISVTAPDDSMVTYVCGAANRAVSFLSKYQLKPTRVLRTVIIDKNLNQDGYEAIGMYDRRSDRIFIMSLPALLEISPSPQMYNMAFDEEHYIGAIAHEITHAIFEHNASTIEGKWNNAAQEYLAHATQLGVLSPQRRREIIESEGAGPWESGDEISVTYMGINTTGFAVKSYLHLTRMTEPQPFVQILLNHKWLYISVP